MTNPIRGLYLAVTPNSLLGCFVLSASRRASLIFINSESVDFA
nr:MAG TPA: hypothetical protein [Caudoviricetes sp.]